jgi:hypothetical protein
MRARSRLRHLGPYPAIQIGGSLAGIVSLVVVLVGGLSGTQRFVLALSALLAVTAIAVAALLARRRPLEPMTWSEMIDTGCGLIEHYARDRAVLFADDLSWASEHRPQITKAVARGTAITVIFPARKRAVAEQDASMLRSVGAHVVAVAQDPPLRAVLIDPDDPPNALLYVVSPARGSDALRVGRSGARRANFEGKVYRWKEDAVLIATAVKLYEALSD